MLKCNGGQADANAGHRFAPFSWPVLVPYSLGYGSAYLSRYLFSKYPETPR